MQTSLSRPRDSQVYSPAPGRYLVDEALKADATPMGSALERVGFYYRSGSAPSPHRCNRGVRVALTAGLHRCGEY